MFTSAVANEDHRIRRLAIRGLEAVADDINLQEALDIALKDGVKAVRKYAHKVCKRSEKHKGGGIAARNEASQCLSS